MSNRTGGGRGGRKDRPRTVERRAKGAEKASTPTQEVADETAQSVKSVIWNDEIEALRVTEEELNKIHSPRPPSGERKTPPRVPITVRKMKPPEVLNRPKPKSVIIAKPAPLDVPVRPMDYSNCMGPRFDENGGILSHSILGSVGGFMQEAQSRGEFMGMGIPHDPEAGRAATPSVKYERQAGRARAGGIDEHKALQNWLRRMRERKQNQGYISKLLGKPSGRLIMNQSEQYRKEREEQHLIDRTIPLVDYGKGYRVGSEFWKQQEPFGDELTGLHMTLTQTERGFPPPVEFIGMPDAVKRERGVLQTPPRTPHKPWHRTEYLRERQEQLQTYIQELVPHRPEFEDLAVVGSNQPYRGEPDARSDTGTVDYSGAELDQASDMELEGDGSLPGEQSFLGPSINFGGTAARWTGDSHSHVGKLGAEARVSIETEGSSSVIGHLDVKNDGSTTIYFKWKKLHKDNPFSVVHAPVQRFYFDTSPGVILPGDTHRFAFVFKSPNAGVFGEKWQLETAPVLAGGAALVVALKGLSLQQDTYREQRESVNSSLRRRKAELEVRSILDDVLSGVRTPERCASPIDAYLTPEELFRRNNPALEFSAEPVREMLGMYVDLCPEEADDPQWDQSVDTLKDMIMCVDEDDPRKETMLQRINALVATLSYPAGEPLSSGTGRTGYMILSNFIDSMVGGSMQLRASLGLPEREEYYPEDIGSKGKSRTSGGRGTGARDTAKTPGTKPNTAARLPAPQQTSAQKRSSKRARGSVREDENPDDPVLGARYRQGLLSLTHSLLEQSIDQLSGALSEIQ